MKTVLFLINGLGVEHKTSYPIYDKEVVPNFDMLMGMFMFERLRKTVSNYQDAYRNASLDINEIYNYSIVRKAIDDGSFGNNETFKNIKVTLDARDNSKLHIMCLVDRSMKIIDDLKYVLKIINPIPKDENVKRKTVFLHCILVSNSYEDYNQIQEVLSKMNAELANYATIGMVMGLASLSNSISQVDMNFNIKIWLSEVGERWQSFKQKFEVSENLKQAPVFIKPFIVNTGFKLESEDQIFFFNYDNINLTNFMKTIKAVNYGEGKPNNILYYSLFPVKYDQEVPHILDFKKADESLAKTGEGLGFKTLVMAKKAQINTINYYLNGLENVANPNINFVEFDNYLYHDDEIINVINNYDHELMIINYDIEGCKTVEELKDTLKKIDTTLGRIYENMKTNSYTIVVSSLYSKDQVLTNEKNEVCTVRYNEFLPLIYIDNFVTKKDYIINPDGTINNLFKICYKAINKSYPGNSLVTKKNILFKLFFK